MRRASFGAIVAIFGMAAALSLAYSAGAKPGSGNDRQKLAKALRTCKKDESKSKRKKCEKTAEAKYKSETKTGGHTGTGTATAPGPTGKTLGTGTSTMGTGTGTGTTGTGTSTMGTGTGTGTTGTGTGTTGTGTTGTTTGTPEALSATLIVHVYASPEFCCMVHEPGPSPDETQPLRIIRSLTDGEDKLTTSEHTVHLAPGSYEVQVISTGTTAYVYDASEVTLSAGQIQELTFTIKRCAAPGAACPE